MAKIISEVQRFSLGDGVEIKFLSQPFDDELFLVGVYAVLPIRNVKLTETQVVREMLGSNGQQMAESNFIVSESDAIIMANRFSVAMRSGKYDNDIIEEVINNA